MSVRIPWEVPLPRIQLLVAPIEFDEFLDPNRSAQSKIDVTGMSPAEITTMLHAAALRMPEGGTTYIPLGP